MNGSRSAPPRHGDRSSLDALNRTIEGLEARIQGLMANAGRPAQQERVAVGASARPPAPALAQPPQAAPQHVSQHTAGTTRSVLAEIRERQRALEQAVQQAASVETAAEAYVEAPRMAAPRRIERQAAPMAEPQRQPEPRYAAAPIAEASRQRMVAARLSDATHRSDAAPASAAPGVQDFTDALARLRQDLKRDFSDGFGREMKVLKDEVRDIKMQAEDHRLAPNVQSDLSRLAQGIDQLTMHATPEAAGLRAEFEALRTVMDGLAREDSLQQMQHQWQGLEERIQEADASALKQEIVALAYRTDEIRNQLGLMSDSPVIRALEEKLLALAGMMEKLGTHMQPSDAEIGKQFGLLDQRLDEISRAIAANVRAPASTALDDIALQRLEGRLGALMDHVEEIGRATSDSRATDGLTQRIELLTGKIEELAEEQAAARLEERIEQLTALVQELQPAGQTEELTGYLSDISRKIDALDSNFAEQGLGERLEYLARRIDEMEQPAADEESHAAFGRIEDRLTDIAARLDEASTSPPGNDEALRGLEAQIAHLSTLISQPSSTQAWSPEFDTRMAAIEGYMATNDEYIVEAARQAAETVIEAYSRNISAGTGSSADVAALSGLAEDLKHLEDLARGSETRTHQTFEALHGTLVQIAERLDKLEGQISSGGARAPRVDEHSRQPAFAAAVPASAPARQPAVAAASADPAMAPALSAELVEELAGMTVPQAEATLRDSSAISSTLANHLPAHAVERDEAVADEEEDEQAPAKAGLLSGLTRRFRTSGKPEAAPVARTVVEPTPSIDPSEVLGDVLPPERENDLLEPGSGAPDVKKILERVRASQAAGDFDREKTGERADYIAAARRAAKAAAQEADPSQLGSMAKPETKAGRPKTAAAKAAKGPSAFSQHRRPILMAVGAVLLALMAMPLIKTVTTSEPAPQTAAIQAPAQPDARQPAAPAPDVASETGTTAPEAATTDMATDQAPLSATQMPADTDSVTGTDGSVNDGAALGPVVDSATPDSLAELPDPIRPQAEAPAERVAAEITVPAVIEPKSLADAAKAGDANALFEIGARFSDGRGVTADTAEASKWYRLAADRGLPPAQYRLGNMLEKGTGVVRNLNEAMSYYQQAAKAGNASAMHNLAVLYASGAAGQPNYPAAVEWFRNAANHGVVDSQFNLAILYARGNGVKQDLEESYKWFGAAAAGGDQDAAQKRDEVAKAMRKDQVDSARAKLDAWKAIPLDPKANSVDVPDEWASGKALTTASVDMSKAIRNIQAILNRNGFDAGTPDGKMGAKTVAAIKAFQSSIGQEATGKVNDALVRELLARNS